MSPDDLLFYFRCFNMILASKIFMLLFCWLPCLIKTNISVNPALLKSEASRCVGAVERNVSRFLISIIFFLIFKLRSSK